LDLKTRNTVPYKFFVRKKVFMVSVGNGNDQLCSAFDHKMSGLIIAELAKKVTVPCIEI